MAFVYELVLDPGTGEDPLIVPALESDVALMAGIVFPYEGRNWRVERTAGRRLYCKPA